MTKPAGGDSAGVPSPVRIDIKVDLNTEDETALPWTYLDQAPDPSRVIPGTYVVAGWGTVAEIVDVGEDGVVHLRPLANEIAAIGDQHDDPDVAHLVLPDPLDDLHARVAIEAVADSDGLDDHDIGVGPSVPACERRMVVERTDQAEPRGRANAVGQPSFAATRRP